MGSFSTYNVIIPMAHSASVITYSDEYCTASEQCYDAPVPAALVSRVRKDISLPCFITGPVTGVISSKARHNLAIYSTAASDSDLIRMKECFLSSHPEVSADEIVLRRSDEEHVILYNFSSYHFSLFGPLEGRCKLLGYASFVRL